MRRREAGAYADAFHARRDPGGRSVGLAGAEPAPRKLTKNCKHGDKGACMHCDEANEAEIEAHYLSRLVRRASVAPHASDDTRRRDGRETRARRGRGRDA